MSTYIHLHPGMSRPDNWRTRGRSAVYLGKGDLEGSLSGYYAVAMALVMLRVGSRAELRTLDAPPEGKLHRFHEQARCQPAGLDEEGMERLLANISPLIRWRTIAGSRSAIADGILERLRNGAACVLTLGDEFGQYREWCLVVGSEWRGDGRENWPTALLTLDPLQPIARLGYRNARLELLEPPDGLNLHYTTPNSIRVAQPICAFALERG